jgi:hypothetical protein
MSHRPGNGRGQTEASPNARRAGVKRERAFSLDKYKSLFCSYPDINQVRRKKLW